MWSRSICPDLLAVAPYYLDWTQIGGGVSNYLCYGDLPTNGFADVARFKFPRGAVLDRDLSQVHPVDPHDPDGVQESIAHSWYSYREGDDKALHPWDGETKFNYTGPKPPYENLNVDGKYSWLKTPRWKGHAMEVGPLARMLVGYASGQRGDQGGGDRDPGGPEGAGRRCCSRPSAAPRPAASRRA